MKNEDSCQTLLALLEHSLSKLAEVFQKQLSGMFIDLQHVGSTSVTGLSSKPVLDIDLVIDSVEALPCITEKREKMGYTSKGIIVIPDRYIFTADSALSLSPLTNPRRLWMKHNLYVCISGSTALKNHIRFRDYLRSDKKAVAQYGELKYRLAEDSDSIEKYASDKTEYISAILKHCGFSEAELDDIQKVNILND